jgi:hypothetical protein
MQFSHHERIAPRHSTYRSEPVACPSCGTECDGHTQSRGEPHAPEPGDVTLCFYCAQLAFFTPTGLRAATDAERAELLKDRALAETVGALLVAIAERRS